MIETNSTRRCPIFWQRLKQILHRIYGYEVLWWIISITGVSVIAAGAFWRLSEDLRDSQKSIIMIAYDLIFILSCAAVALIAIRKRWDWLLWIAVISGVLAIGLFLSWVYWEDLHGTEDSVSTTIRNLGLVVGGVVAIILAVWRSTVAERQADTAQQSLLNERYQRAAEMLGNDVLSVRLAGIYALEHLAVEHPEQYHVEAMKLLCAFARNPTKEDVEGEEVESTRTDRPRDDVQDAMTAIGRRNEARIRLERDSGFKLDLRSADLRRVRLKGANLSGAVLDEANLTEAILIGANLSCASLWSTNLSSTLFAQPPNGEDDESDRNPAKGLTQNNLNKACADSKPRLICYVVDPETNVNLKWIGGPCG